jgi:16S rRNA processing protein RimM
MAGASSGTQAGDERRVVLGQVAGPHGVRGWIRIRTFTEAVEALLDYPRWMLRDGDVWESMEPLEGRRHGGGLLVRLEGVTDRDRALELKGRPIAVWRHELAPLDEDDYYWSDLQGLAVVTVDGAELGRVERVFATGANDVMVVQGDREHLIPFILEQVVVRVDLDAGRLEVDWDPDF